MSDLRPSTIYLTRTGLLEPLGQSQVLSYACGLAKDHAITILSFEREDDLRRKSEVERIQEICDSNGIRWRPFRYRRKPRVLASALNLLTLLRATARVVRSDDVRLIHARSYIPAAAAWLVSRRTGVPFIFDMRSLWPEELITSGRLTRGSFLHRIIFWAEGRLLKDAAAVVSLTRAGARYLQAAHPGRLDERRLTVMPTCTDLDRFRPAPRPGPIIIGCHGSLASGWFRIDLLAAMFSRLAARLPDAKFEVLTREDPGVVLCALRATGRLQRDVESRLTIEPALPSEIHLRLQRQSLSLFFYASGETSELGRSPTRMGEALGCGVPVVTNVGIGDTADVVLDAGVGLVLDGEDDAALDKAAAAAVALIGDPIISGRCRAAAEAIYSLDAGIADYRRAYQELIRPVASAADDR